jgi:hypothetical protein
MAGSEAQPKLSDKDKVDAYLTLYARQMDHFEKTQSIEWQVTIGVWTLIAAAIAWAHSLTNAELGSGTHAVLRIVLLVIPLFHLVWLILLRGSKSFDKRLWTRYRAAARALLLAPDTVPTDETRSEPRIWVTVTWLVLEFSVTLMLVFILLVRL